MHIIQPHEHVRTRWKNGGGWTTEIARCPPSADLAFDWRISVADIESDGAFSHFENVDRHLVLLSGNGIELAIDGAAALRLAERFAHVRFRGEAAVDCRLVEGATRDFNVMTRRDHVRAEVWPRPLVGSMLLLPEVATEWFVHVFAGAATARCGDEFADLEAGGSLLVDDGRRVLLDGGGELLLVKFVRAGAGLAAKPGPVIS